MDVGYVSRAVQSMLSDWTRKAIRLSFNILKIAWYAAGALWNALRMAYLYYNDKVVALWTLGPAGDQNPKFMSYNEEPLLFPDRAPGYPIIEALGLLLGEEVVGVAGKIERLTLGVRIEADERVVSCPARIPPRDSKRPGMEYNKSIL